MHELNSLVRWPTGEAYPNEQWKVIKATPRDLVIENKDGYRATVHPLSVTDLD
jgi:hypothetical protein